MKQGKPDDLDKHIIHALQKDARHTSSGDIAEKIGISPSTVRNRLQQLEETEIITGYHVGIDYEKMGFQLYAKIVCTAPIAEREQLAKEALEVSGVAAVREIMTGHENIYINVVGTDHDDLNRITRDLDELGLEVSNEQIIRNEYVCPYHGFARDAVE